MKTKKIAGIVIAVLAVLTGGFFGIRHVRNSNRKAPVVPVSMLSQQYYEEGSTAYGNVYDADSQNIYLEPTAIVEQIYVSEGQQVHKGDPLIAFDQTSQQLTYEIKALEVESLRNQLAEAQNDLIRLQNARPAPVPVIEPEPVPEPEPSDEPEPSSKPEPTPTPEPTPAPTPAPIEEELKGEAWTALKRLDQNYETDDGVLHYLLTEDGLLYGSFFNELKTQPAGTLAVLEVRQGNTKDGALMSAWTINSGFIMADYDDAECWFIMSHDKVNTSLSVIEKDSKLSAMEGSGWSAPTAPQASIPAEQGSTPSASTPENYDGMYTREELAEMIRQKKIDIRDLDLQVRRAALALKMMKDDMSDGILYASKDGVVKMLGDPDNRPQDGSPFMVVASGSGLTIRASVSELLLDKVRPGTPVNVTSYETGEVFPATVQSVDVYPTQSNMYGGGNPNVSYYDFYVYSEEAPSIPPYAYLEVAFGAGEASSRITLENAFIRSDANGSYVMKDEDGKLKKQYVKTGKTFYGYATEIVEGLSEEDMITFPYGDGGVEGAASEVSDDVGVFYR
ncbi:MAG: biotin/lipoyl-binding protein [Erysipelotrichaceae bacterium]|nr:biotin/lipoyl-binding protein [Erysipelotrichaceae bacterium]